MHNLHENLESDLLAELVTLTILNIRQKEKESAIKPKLLECKKLLITLECTYILFIEVHMSNHHESVRGVRTL